MPLNRGPLNRGPTVPIINYVWSVHYLLTIRVCGVSTVRITSHSENKMKYRSWFSLWALVNHAGAKREMLPSVSIDGPVHPPISDERIATWNIFFNNKQFICLTRPTLRGSLLASPPTLWYKTKKSYSELWNSTDLILLLFPRFAEIRGKGVKNVDAIRKGGVILRGRKRLGHQSSHVFGNVMIQFNLEYNIRVLQVNASIPLNKINCIMIHNAVFPCPVNCEERKSLLHSLL